MPCAMRMMRLQGRAAPSAWVRGWGEMWGWCTVYLQPRADPQLIHCWHVAPMTNNLCCCQRLRFLKLLIPQHDCSKMSFYYMPRAWAYIEYIAVQCFCSLAWLRSPLWSGLSSPAMTRQSFPGTFMFMCPLNTLFLLPGILLVAYQIMCNSLKLPWNTISLVKSPPRLPLNGLS